MGYRDNIKVLLMRGKAYKSKGQGIAGEDNMRKLNIGKGSKKGSNFKPLKFNF
jgi:hypothetical protein